MDLKPVHKWVSGSRFVILCVQRGGPVPDGFVHAAQDPRQVTCKACIYWMGE